MPKIIILNVGTEHALGDRASSTHPITRSGWRHAWFAEQGDILISPVAIDDDFLRYLGGTLGFDAATVTVLSRERIVTDELLLSGGFLKELRELTGTGSDWRLMPCFWTQGVAELASLLGTAPRAGLGFALQRGSDLLNRKTHFRQLAAGAGLPLPEGSVVRTPRELARAIEQHLPRTGTVIVKQDDGAGGLGNLTLTTGEVAPLPGSRETRAVGEDLSALSAEVWGTLADESSHGLVVESYHASTQQFYLEYVIDESGAPVFLNSGEIRVRPDGDPAATELVWVGLDLPAALPPGLSAQALTESRRLVTLIAQIGHQGHINIDAITTETGELVFNEINARWGGGLVAHSICERLIGSGYADHHVASTLRDVPPAPLDTVLRLLDEHGLRFSRETLEGVIVLACDPLLINNMECLVVGTTRDRAREIEARLLEALKPIDAVTGGA
ncbi:peptide ligase PGM1-related protein [Streptomyces monomycini]|uniref:preATP grasp domain-containing protein n=1 Tax=Streptomyces monomycini TaxID=371720 RepID=UPI00067D0BD0|nr:peptide ligase PGM1-related protein [Streptomyces monomycini]